ncbi:hypothetical protein [Flavobacterium sp. 3HN19-14]|uniref:hypothetical protein n=1 Tax=Flavobacterium sp. 3HN19-14 TaxID=3448133 RepID=UPI003EE412D7
MIHPDTEIRFINKTVGYGVVATKFIPKGTITWVQDELDFVFTQQKADDMSPLIQKHLETYCFRNAEGDKILCWGRCEICQPQFQSELFFYSLRF